MVTGNSTKPGLNSTQSREFVLGALLSEFMGKLSSRSDAQIGFLMGLGNVRNSVLPRVSLEGA